MGNLKTLVRYICFLCTPTSCFARPSWKGQWYNLGSVCIIVILSFEEFIFGHEGQCTSEALRPWSQVHSMEGSITVSRAGKTILQPCGQRMRGKNSPGFIYTFEIITSTLSGRNSFFIVNYLRKMNYFEKIQIEILIPILQLRKSRHWEVSNLSTVM